MFDNISNWGHSSQGQKVMGILFLLSIPIIIYVLAWAYSGDKSCGDAGGIECRVQRAEQAGCDTPTPVYDSIAGLRNENAIELALSNCGY